MRFQCGADRLMAIRPTMPPIVVRSAPCLGVISSTIRLITARIAVSGRYAALMKCRVTTGTIRHSLYTRRKRKLHAFGDFRFLRVYRPHTESLTEASIRLKSEGLPPEAGL
jgi:hypothetical protein